MKKNVIAMILTAGMAASVMAGCASSGEETKSAGTDTQAAANAQESSQAEGAEGKVNLVFWTGLSGQPGEIIQQVVDDYNSSQDKVFVDLQYQGSYQESLNKLKTSMRTQDGPDLVQIYEAGTRIMIDSGFVIPMQQIIDEYEIDVSGLEENMLNYYTVDGQLYSMPLNTSVPVCYYNKTALSQIGYENGPETWDDIVDISQKVMEQGLATSGIAMCSNLIWSFEQPMVQQHYAMVDNENGRTGRATKTTFADGELALEVATRINDLVANGYAADVGFTIDANRAAFWSGEAAMMCDSSGSITTSLETIDGAFELGVCPFPALTAEAPNGGVTLGGGSVYICDNGKGDANNDAIADFMKYIISPEAQGYIFANTGYFPVTSAALEEESVKETLEAYPQYQAVIDTVHNSPNMGFGPLYASLVDAREIYSAYLEQMMLGEITPDECIQKSAEEIDILIEEYNSSNVE